MKIALDAFGGDLAPQATVNGAILAIKENSTPGSEDLRIILIGNRRKLKAAVEEVLPPQIDFLDISEDAGTKIDDPHAIGDNPDSPIRTALRLHREGEFDAVVSAGYTAAQVIASLKELEKIPGITRPAVGSFLPTAKGNCYLIDVGASLVAGPHHLVQFAAMGHVYVEELLGLKEPRIGILNVGGESGIGDPVVVEAHRLLSDSGFNYAGFVEGRDIPRGAVDIVVTNGFVGNILLKYTEGIPDLLKNVVDSGKYADFSDDLNRVFDYQLFGGEPLLGVKGISVICHGASSARAICAGIMQAARMVKIGIHHKLELFLTDKFESYFSQVKYLKSFRRSFRLPGRSHLNNSGKTEDN